MKITAGEHFIELHPETDFEIEQLNRLDRPRECFTTQLIPAPNDSYPPTMKKGARLQIIIPEHTQ